MMIFSSICGIESDEHAGGDEDDGAEAFGKRDGRAAGRSREWACVCGGLGEEGFLHGAPDVDDADDDADADAEGEHGEGAPGADQNHQFGDEAAEAGQAHAGHSGDDEGDGGEGNDLLRFIGPSAASSRVWVRA